MIWICFLMIIYHFLQINIAYESLTCSKYITVRYRKQNVVM